MKEIEKRNIRRILRWILFLFFIVHLFVSHVGFKGYALCVGLDGHISIETATEGTNCNDSKSTPLQTEQANYAISPIIFSESHCGVCVDVLMGFECHEYTMPKPKNNYSQSNLAAYQTNPYMYLVTNEGSTKANNLNINGSNSSLASLQTIVLLI
jgi:hypothetical protein